MAHLMTLNSPTVETHVNIFLTHGVSTSVIYMSSVGQYHDLAQFLCAFIGTIDSHGHLESMKGYIY